MTHQLSGLAEGRVVVALEGGYNLSSISESAAMCARALLGDPLPRQGGLPSYVQYTTLMQCPSHGGF
jgi:acetoin utilization deacetylase AcuC-like enzyme